jgi:hypothetical protein
VDAALNEKGNLVVDNVITEFDTQSILAKIAKGDKRKGHTPTKEAQPILKNGILSSQNA